MIVLHDAMPHGAMTTVTLFARQSHVRTQLPSGRDIRQLEPRIMIDLGELATGLRIQRARINSFHVHAFLSICTI